MMTERNAVHGVLYAMNVLKVFLALVIYYVACFVWVIALSTYSILRMPSFFALLVGSCLIIYLAIRSTWK